MGTRSLTHVHNDAKDSEIITTIYRQFDGYPTGIGADIKSAGVMRIVNGYSGSDVAGAAANGMGCYAAQLVAKLKEGRIGNVYLYPPGAKDCWEEYTYHLWTESGELFISVEGGCEWSGKLADFDPEKVENQEAA